MLRPIPQWMKKCGKKSSRLIHAALFTACLAVAPWLSPPFLFPSEASKAYRFERMWPTLQQPWYFSIPLGMAVDPNGNLLIAEQGNQRISKFTPDGRLISSLGETGSEEFSEIWGMALDHKGNIYVADSGSSSIRKFTPEGRFIKKWGSPGKADGHFNTPAGVALDGAGDVYVLDIDNQRIQKFTSDGRFIRKWGKGGRKPGEFSLRSSVTEGKNPWFAGIAAGRDGSVYVSDIGNNRVQKFDSKGRLLALWGSRGEKNAQFENPAGIALDRQGNVYVVDSGNGRIEKFNSKGKFIGTAGSGWSPENPGGLFFPWAVALDSNGEIYVSEPLSPAIKKLGSSGAAAERWSSAGSKDGFFDYPAACAIDRYGHIYVADYFNCRIQKFSPTGQLIAKWGKYGTGEGEFALPVGIALSEGGEHVYVVDQNNHRIQEFTQTGAFIRQWGSEGSEEGKFEYPFHVAVDREENIYVTDTGNYRVQKFGPDGSFICAWGSQGKKEGQFGWYYFFGDIAADKEGYIYVTDGDNKRVQKFDSNGRPVEKWAGNNSGKGGLNHPNSVATEAGGNVCVIDWSSPFSDAVTSLKLYTREGEFIESWGEQGINPGQLHFPSSISLSQKGGLAICDYELANVQLFRKTSLDSKNKAIIVAGGGPIKGDHLWEATEMNANFAYRTLLYQGFTKERIYYLSSDTGLDLDKNGEADDVDEKATSKNLRKALLEWAPGARDLILYMVDHGGEGSFRMSSKETLGASDLASWLESLEPLISGKLIIVYDACHSGSFLPFLSSPPGKERIIISGTSPGENAYFVNHGAISFSNYFWTHIFNGLDVFNSFSLAAKAMGQTTEFQHPLLDDNGNGIGNEAQDGALAQTTFIGNGTNSSNEAPTISAVSGPQTIRGKKSAELYARGVKDKDGVARVWAVIRPPDLSPGPDGTPVRELPSIDFTRSGKNLYSATWEGFSSSGTYQIGIYAMDGIGNISIPKLTTVSVDSPLSRKAILIAGGSQSDDLWPAIEKSAASAHEALVFQGYKEDDILFMSPVTIPGVDLAPSLKNLRYAIEEWAGKNTQDLVLFLVGNANGKTFELSPKESLSAAELKRWIDTFQIQSGARAIVLFDACSSESFLPLLKPPEGKERIVIASTGKDVPAAFLSGGDISYSRFFWNQVANGASVREAFLQAKDSIRYVFPEQIASLDDNGNGLGNERTDGDLAARCVLGAGIVWAEDAPVIGRVCPKKRLSGSKSATLWVEELTSTSGIERVWAIIRPPDQHLDPPSQPLINLPCVELHEKKPGHYAGEYHHFEKAGTYEITIYARDKNGKISTPAKTNVYREAE